MRCYFRFGDEQKLCHVPCLVDVDIQRDLTGDLYSW